MVFLEFVQVFYKHGALSFFWIVCFLINMIMAALILTIIIIVICIFCYFSNIFNRVETVRYDKPTALIQIFGIAIDVSYFTLFYRTHSSIKSPRMTPELRGGLGKRREAG